MSIRCARRWSKSPIRLFQLDTRRTTSRCAASAARRRRAPRPDCRDPPWPEQGHTVHPQDVDEVAVAGDVVGGVGLDVLLWPGAVGRRRRWPTTAGLGRPVPEGHRLRLGRVATPSTLTRDGDLVDVVGVDGVTLLGPRRSRAGCRCRESPSCGGQGPSRRRSARLQLEQPDR